MPSVSRERPHVYSYADVGEVILAHYLIEQRVTPREIRAIVRKLRATYGSWPLANAPLEHDGRLVVVHVGDDLYFTAADGQDQGLIAGTLLNLKAVRVALGNGGWAAFKHPRMHIEVDPDRHSGRPVVRGRRITTQMVAEIAAEGHGRGILQEDYGLSDDEIDDAVAYERDVEELAA